jgi:hypothetical protein
MNDKKFKNRRKVLIFTAVIHIKLNHVRSNLVNPLCEFTKANYLLGERWDTVSPALCNY